MRLRIETIEIFEKWFEKLRDRRAQQKVAAAIIGLARGVGTIKRLTATVSEAKIDYGPGYRLYFTYRGDQLIILLCGGDKRTQSRDIRKAEELAAQLE